ncbi:MAG: hypothetical protein AAFV90_26435 [Cyanobacteria bacterium J06634_5]
MGTFSKKPKRVLRGVVVDGYQSNRGWRVKMTGGILWFAHAKYAGAKFKIGDAVQALESVDTDNKLRIAHDPSVDNTMGESA